MSNPALIMENLTKDYGTSTPVVANLSLNGVPLANREITFNINGVDYRRTTNTEGNASLNINLIPGVYGVTATYQESIVDAVVTINRIKPKVKCNDLTKTYGTKEQFKVQVKDFNNNPMPGRNITIKINGVTYTKTTDADGVASLNINLPPGLYGAEVKTFTDHIYERVTLNKTVRVNKQATFMDGTNITKFAKDTAVYQCAIYNESGERVQAKVNLKVNGVEYVRETDNE